MKTVLAIGAHPDDIEIGCGGTELILKDRDYRLIHVIVTSGEEGSLSSNFNELASTREAEAIASAEILKADEVVFLRFPDGLTAYSKEMKIEVIKQIRKFKPEIVFTHSSSDHFSDHSVVHALSMSAITAAAGPWYPASLKPHSVSKIYGYEVWHPLNRHQLVVDVTSVMNKKLEALACHKTQTKDVAYLEGVQGLARFRGAMTMVGKFAEVFEVLKTKEDL